LAEGAFCAGASTTPTNRSSTSLHETTQHRNIIAERFTYHFVVAMWRTKQADFPYMKTNTFFLILISLLTGFTFLQPTQAVVPPPDGGYPSFNTAEGQNALFNLTSGAGNTALGWYSLFSNTDGSFNTGVGAGTLALNTGGNNTAVGGAALLSNTTGIDNTAVGVTALVSNSTGYFNTATGVNALSSNSGGVSNNAFGWGTLLSNTTGTNNNAIGVRALQNNNEGNANVAVGEQALLSNTIGSGNTAIGFFALQNSNGIENTALGYSAGSNVNSGSGNVCIGSGVTGIAGFSNRTWIRNIWGQPGGTQAVYVDSEGRLGGQHFFTPFQGRDRADGQGERSDLLAQAGKLPVQDGD
jgi:hypothetical protein